MSYPVGRGDSDFEIAQEAVSTLSDTVCAMHIDVPQLELYSWVASDLQQWIERSKDNFKQAEEEAALVTPGLFREFSQANEEGREELLVSSLTFYCKLLISPRRWFSSIP